MSPRKYAWKQQAFVPVRSDELSQKGGPLATWKKVWCCSEAAESASILQQQAGAKSQCAGNTLLAESTY